MSARRVAGIWRVRSSREVRRDPERRRGKGQRGAEVHGFKHRTSPGGRLDDDNADEVSKDLLSPIYDESNNARAVWV